MFWRIFFKAWIFFVLLHILPALGGSFMQVKTVVYLKCSRSSEVYRPKVYLEDVANVYSADPAVTAACKALTVYRFTKTNETKAVLSVIHLIALIEKECPEVHVMSVGENDVLVEYMVKPQGMNFKQRLKIGMVCAVCFFGTAFTIMAFHNDIEISSVFERIYVMWRGQVDGAISVLEISYSAGLAAGIVVFFGHLGKINLTRDPSPIQVSMKTYEKDVDYTIIESAGRGGMELEK